MKFIKVILLSALLALGPVFVSSNDTAFAATPTVAALDSFGSTSNTTNCTFTFPASGIDAGDLFINLISKDSSFGTIAFPVGDWADNELVNEPQSPGDDHRYAASYFIADGTEESTTFDVVLSNDDGWAGWLIHIQNWHGTTPPEVGTRGTQIGANDDTVAVALTPSGWDSSAGETLWLWYHVTDGAVIIIDTFPTEMPDNNNNNNPGAGAPNNAIAFDDTVTATRSVAGQTANMSAVDTHQEMLFGIRGSVSGSAVPIIIQQHW